MLGRQEAPEQLHALRHGLLQIGLHRHLGLHQLQGSEEKCLELGDLRHDPRPTHDVVGAQEGEPLAECVGQFLLLPTLQEAGPDDERRTQLLFLAGADELHVACPVLAQVELGHAHAQHLAGVDEDPAQHELVGG